MGLSVVQGGKTKPSKTMPQNTIKHHDFQISLVSTYHSARNKFEPFREFSGLISRFEFHFRRRGIFF